MAGESLGYEVHHIFPDAVMEKLQKDLDVVMGDSRITKDDYSNRINLFNNQEMADVMKTFYTTQVDSMSVAEGFGSVMHKGSVNNHSGYSDFIRQSLTDILSRNADDNTKKYMILDLHKNVSHALKVGDIDLWGDANSYTTYFTNSNNPNHLLDINKLSVLSEDKKGNPFYQFNKNADAVKELGNYESTYKRTSMVSNETVVKEDFKKIIANIDVNSKVYDIPYSQLTLNNIKKALASGESSDMRVAMAQMVYDEAKKSNLITTKTEENLFREMADDDPNKEFLADKISKNPNVSTDIKAEATKFLENVNKLQETIVKNGFGTYFDDLAEIKNLKEVNAELAKKLLEKADFANKFNTVANVTDFLNNVYDSFIKGWKTGNWDDFRDDLVEYGQEVVMGIVIGYVVIAGLTAAAAAGVAGAEAALVVAAVAGVAATIYSVYELYEKVQDTDFNELIDITKQNFQELFEDSKDWLLAQKDDAVLAFSEMMKEFKGWNEKNGISPLLKDVKDTFGVAEKDNSDNFHFNQILKDPENQNIGTEKSETLTNIKADNILYGASGDDTLIGNIGVDILIGGDGNDILKGNEGNDILSGNAGNDTLDGGKGNDNLVGGTGYDTYILEGNDIIFDSDGQGKLQYANGTTIPTLTQTGKNVWMQTEGTATYIALKDGNNLILTQQDTQNGQSTQTTIKDFFVTAHQSSDSISGLNLNLQINPTINETSNSNVLVTNPNYTANIYASGLTAPITIVSSQKGDTIFGSGNQKLNVDMQGGNDLIYASTKSDLVRGGDGHDIIFGTNPYYDGYVPDQQPKEDHDILYGGAGNDLIYGGVGNDTIYANDETSYQSTVSTNQKGDWLMGATGNDFIYGSEGRDFLQGGKDMDVIYGGASDDVIIGDSNIRFGSKAQTIYNLSDDTGIGYEPTSPLHPLLPPSYQPVITTPTANTLSIDYTFDGSKWTNKNLESLYFRDKSTFDWDISINTNANDYQLTTPVALASNELALESEHAQDFLYGGAGNDLIIGQYGDDMLMGDDGDDILWGDDNRNLDIQGNDWLDGGAGNDKLFGSKGSDTLVGSLGRDIMDGGVDYDTYTFSLASLSDGETKTIIDSDGNGRIVINGQDWSQKVWQHDTPHTNSNEQVFTDGQGNQLVKVSEGNYQITSTTFTSMIVIQSQSATQENPLGLQLATPNQEPTVANPVGNQTFTANEVFNLALATGLFTDPDGDSLTYSVTLADGSALPSWMSFNPTTNTLTGTPPAHTNLAIKVTATDPAGAVASQNFTLQSNSRPTINQPLEAQQYIQTHKGDWTQSVATAFVDNDNDSLTYQVASKNGTLPTGISIDSQTGLLHVDTNIISKGSYDLTITATDIQGASISTSTQINLVDSLKTPKSGLNTGTLGDDVFVATGSTGLIINGLSGNDLLKGSAGNDTLNGGLNNDILVGNKGNDKLIGGFGNDTYVFNKGDGQDSIFDISGKDTIKFGNGITSHDIWMSKQGLDLQISLIGSTDKITVEGWFIMPNQRVESIELTSGQKLSGDNLNSLIATMNTSSQTALNDTNFVNKVEQYWVI